MQRQGRCSACVLTEGKLNNGQVLRLQCKCKGRCSAYGLTKSKLDKGEVQGLKCKGKGRCLACLTNGKLDKGGVLLFAMQGQRLMLDKGRVLEWKCKDLTEVVQPQGSQRLCHLVAAKAKDLESLG